MPTTRLDSEAPPRGLQQTQQPLTTETMIWDTTSGRTAHNPSAKAGFAG